MTKQELPNLRIVECCATCKNVEEESGMFGGHKCYECTLIKYDDKEVECFEKCDLYEWCRERG